MAAHMRGARRDVALIGLGSAVAAALQLLVGVASARALAPDGRGALALLIAWAGVVSHFTVFGSDVVVARTTGKRDVAAAALVGWVFLYAAVAGMCGALLYGTILVSTKSLFGTMSAVIAFAIFVASSAGSILLRAMLLALGRFTIFSLLSVMLPSLVLIMYMILWIIGTTRADLFFLGYASCSLIFVFATANTIVRLDAILVGLLSSADVWRRLFVGRREAIAAGIGSMLRVAETNLPVVILGFVADQRAVGLFVVAGATCAVQSLLAEAYSRYAFGTAASDQACKSPMRTSQLWLSQLLMALVTAPIGWLLLPTIFGQAFEPARRLVPYFVVATLIGSIALTMSEWLRGAGRSDVILRPRLIAVALLAAVPLVPSGWVEPAEAIILTQAAGALVQVLAFARHWHTGSRPGVASAPSSPGGRPR